MPDVIHLLERIGEDATLRGAALERALTEAALDPALRWAIEHGDQRALEALLGAQTNVCCGLHPAEDDEDDLDEDEREGEKEDGEGDDGELTSQYAAAHRAISAF